MKLILSLILIFTIINSSFCADFGDCVLLKQTILFYKAQRAGRLPDTDVPWRGNSVLNDSSAGSSKDSNGDGNLSKGFFDAGDGVKFAFPMTYTMTMLNWNYLEFNTNIDSCGLQTLYLQVLKWGIDYILASHLSDNEFVAQVGDAYQDHNIWQPPENINYPRTVFTITKNSPGTDLAMEAVASLASASLVFKTIDPSYSANCLQHATTLFNFAMGSTFQKYSTSVSQAYDFYSSYGYNDEIAWGNLWMYKATKNVTYLNTCQLYYQNNNDVMYANEFSWDNKGMGVSLLLWKETQDTQYKSKLEDALNMWVVCNSDRKMTTGGLCFLRQWASNRYSMAVSHLAAIFKVNAGGDVKYSTFAQSQLNYMIGNNIKNQSFITGYGPNSPKNPHHRASHHSTTNNIDSPINNLYTLPGALVGGPLDTSDSYSDSRNSFTSNEVALDYNIGLVGTLSAYSFGISSTSTTTSTSATSTSTTTSTSPTSSTSTTISTTAATTSKPSTSTSTTTSTSATSTSTTTLTSPTSSTSTTISTTAATTSKPSTSTSTTTLGEHEVDSNDELMNSNNSNSLTKLFNSILLTISLISISLL